MPYKEAGIDGFNPPQPFAIASHFARRGDYKDFHWPTLAELNDELWPFPWVDDDERLRILSGDDVVEAECFAFLAVRVLRGLPISFPSTTGVPQPMTGGRIAG